MLNCIIIDDEPLALDILESYISKVPELNLVARCNSAIQAKEVMNHHSIQVMFLDINMPLIDGLSFLRSLKNSPMVILTTAYTQHAIESYELDVFDYLLKPIPFDRFLKAVNKVLNASKGSVVAINTQAPSGYIFIKVDGRMVKLNHEEIVYIEGLKDYLKVHTPTRHYVTHMTMKKMQETLPASLFIRIHKSFILSINAVKSLSGNTVETVKDALPIGAMYKDQLVKNIFKIQG